jgi:RNA polymerase sigma factor (TIGR02999 family)
MADAGEITDLLLEVSEGRGAVDVLVPLLYDELYAMARGRLARERPGHTWSTTSLVHDAYLRLVDQRRVTLRNRSHFLALAATAMRRILIDHARRKRRRKRGAGHVQLSLDEALTISEDEPSTDLLALDEALTKLAALEPERARVVELRFFGGLTNEEVSELLGISDRTVRRHWQYAKAWLYREVAGSAPA